MGRLAKVIQGQAQPGLKEYKRGGAVKHDDVKEDKKMVREMVKPEALTGKRKGGRCGK